MSGSTRRISVGNLVARGLIKPGTRIACKQARSSKGSVIAHVTSQGTIKLESGEEFASPSAAARAVRGVTLNGWVTWKEVDTGRTLAEIRRSAAEPDEAE